MAQALRTVLVDDDEDLRFLVRYLLDADDRFEVVGEAGDGAAGLEMVEQHDPDLLVLDLDMPVLDGTGVAAHLAAESRPTIVVLTGVADHEVERELLALGIAGLLEKSVEPEDLPDRIAALAFAGPREGVVAPE